MLELKNLSFSVEENGKQKEILHDLNLKIDNSRFVVITGPNGSGKSTLAKLIMGIEKPTSGQIIFDGEDITELSITERAKRGISLNVLNAVSALPFSSLSALRVFASMTCSDSRQAKILP